MGAVTRFGSAGREIVAADGDSIYQKYQLPV